MIYVDGCIVRVREVILHDLYSNVFPIRAERVARFFSSEMAVV